MKIDELISDLKNLDAELEAEYGRCEEHGNIAFVEPNKRCHHCG